MSLSPLRTGRITASRVAAILGQSPYQTADDVLREMVRDALGAEPEFTGNDATRYGQAREPEALALYEERAGVMTHGAELHIHPQYEFLAATPDGLVGDDGIVECKCPHRGRYVSLDEAPHYRPQVQLQLAVTGRAWCDFAVLHRDGALYVTREAFDPEWLPTHLPALQAFHARYLAALKAPDEHLAPMVATRDDAEWRAAAVAYRLAAEARVEAESAEKAARDELIALAGGRSCIGAGVRVARIERKGGIDYAKVPALAGVDLEPFRKRGTSYWAVSEVKGE